MREKVANIFEAGAAPQEETEEKREVQWELSSHKVGSQLP